MELCGRTRGSAGYLRRRNGPHSKDKVQLETVWRKQDYSCPPVTAVDLLMRPIKKGRC